MDAAPLVNVQSSVLTVRIVHAEAANFITVDVNTGNVSATSSIRDNTTAFETNSPNQYSSVALPKHYLSMIREENSTVTYFGVRKNQESENSGESGSSSGSGTGSTGGSGEVKNETVYNIWEEERIGYVYRTLKITIDGKDCYLAFEDTGKPVSDPCSISPYDDRTLFYIY